MARSPLTPGRAWTALAALTLTGVAVVSLDRAGIVRPAMVADGLIVGFAFTKARIVCSDYLCLGTGAPGSATRRWRRGITIGVALVLGTAWVAVAGGARP